jgi:ribosomal protein S18 acetylase RimI-like enzyme
MFALLNHEQLKLLFKWLECPHVKLWWDQDVVWTKELVVQKYSTYINGYKLQDGKMLPINAYIICIDTKPIGYVQIYNAYDFPRSAELKDLPISLAAVDIFIGEKNFLHKNIGSMALTLFLQQYCPKKYTHIFVDPNSNNIAAIKSYQKVGFSVIKENIASNEVWMLKENN